MALLPMKLRLEAPDGSGVEEYRILDDGLEVRRTPRPFELGKSDQWQRLTPAEIASHVHGNTVVAQWLRHRIGWRRLLLACTDKQTLEQFGVVETPIDRYAA